MQKNIIVIGVKNNIHEITEVLNVIVLCLDCEVIVYLMKSTMRNG